MPVLERARYGPKLLLCCFSHPLRLPVTGFAEEGDALSEAACWDIRRGVLLRNIRDLDFPRVERSYRDSSALDGTRPASTISRLGLPLDPAALWSCGSSNLCQSMPAATGAFIHRTDYHLIGYSLLPLLAQAKRDRRATCRGCNSRQLGRATLPKPCLKVALAEWPENCGQRHMPKPPASSYQNYSDVLRLSKRASHLPCPCERLGLTLRPFDVMWA